jgi:hypothetical protein
MAGNFVSSLWGATSGNRRLTNLTLTVPPATAGTSFTIQITTSGVSLGTVTAPSGVTWNATSSTFTIGTISSPVTVTLPLTGGNVGSTSFNIVSSGSAQNGTQTTVLVDANGWMDVTTLGSGVTMEGLYYVVQNIPPGGQVQLDDPVLIIPTVGSGQTDFSFSVGVGSGLSNGTLSLSSSSSAVTVSGTTATAQSSLAGGNTATLTATCTVNNETTTSTFTVQRLSSTSVTSGSSSTLNLSSDQSFTVTVLGANTYLRGTGVQYETAAPGSYNLMFYTNTSGLQFESSPITLTNESGFSSSNPSSGVAGISTTNTTGTTDEAGFTLATSMGTLSDPTIINNPDT